MADSAVLWLVATGKTLAHSMECCAVVDGMVHTHLQHADDPLNAIADEVSTKLNRLLANLTPQTTHTTHAHHKTLHHRYPPPPSPVPSATLTWTSSRGLRCARWHRLDMIMIGTSPSFLL